VCAHHVWKWRKVLSAGFGLKCNFLRFLECSAVCTHTHTHTHTNTYTHLHTHTQTHTHTHPNIHTHKHTHPHIHTLTHTRTHTHTHALTTPLRYVHRVGRTARMGHAGESILFLMPHERPYIGMLASKGVTMQVR